MPDCWENAAEFKAWADHILELALVTPDEPVPHTVVCIPATQRPLTDTELAWFRSVAERVVKDRG